MEFGLKGKIALVTGASRGIGLAAAEELAREGASLLMVARDERALEQARSRIAGETGVCASWLAADLAEERSVDEICKAVHERHGGQIDILINNAGASQPVSLDQFVEKSPAGYWTNCLVHIALMRALLPGMRQRRWGRIVNVGGISARQPEEMNTTVLAKASLFTFAKALSRHVAADGITVNTISVGKIDTPQIRRKYAAEERRKAMVDCIPAGRFGRGDEVAAAIAFLSSDRASYVTGTIFTVDGGLASGVYS